MLANDQDLAARCAAAGLKATQSEEPKSADALRLALAGPQAQWTGIRQAASSLLLHDNAGEPSLYADLLRLAKNKDQDASPLRLLLASRCGIEGRRMVLLDGPTGLRQERLWNHRDANTAQQIGQGDDPAWQAELVGYLQRPGDDEARQAAEIAMSWSAYPSTWEALVAAWKTSAGEDRLRLSSVIMTAGNRGTAAILEAILAGSMNGEEFEWALKTSGETTTPIVELLLQVAGNPACDRRFRLALLNRVTFGFCAERDPRVIELALRLAEQRDLDPARRIAAIRQVKLLTRRTNDRRVSLLAHHLAREVGLDGDIRAEAIDLVHAQTKDLADPRAAELGRALLLEGQASGDSSARWPGLGLKLLSTAAGLHANDPLVKQTLADPSPYVRAMALAIIARELQGKNGSPSIRLDGQGGQIIENIPSSPPNPDRSAEYLAVAHEDQHPYVRVRAAEIGLLLLPPAQRAAALAQLIAHERDPETLTIYNNNYKMGVPDGQGGTQWTTRTFLNLGSGFPAWTLGGDGPSAIPVEALEATN